MEYKRIMNAERDAEVWKLVTMLIWVSFILLFFCRQWIPKWMTSKGSDGAFFFIKSRPLNMYPTFDPWTHVHKSNNFVLLFYLLFYLFILYHCLFHINIIAWRIIHVLIIYISHLLGLIQKIIPYNLSQRSHEIEGPMIIKQG